MVAENFIDLRGWVFDLDNTLYPPEARLFDQIERRMTAFVMEALGVAAPEANRLRKRYRAEYGTTLAGLMEVHGVEPGPYLAEVHEISLDHLDPAPELRNRIAALPGRKIVHTNGSAPYAERVLAARGLAGIFDAVYGVEHAGYQPKPRREAFETVLALGDIAPLRAAIFEDDPRNLAEPHAMGMRTVHVAPAPEPADHIHHHTDDLTAFLAALDRE
ncbi:putative hydrolase of the HAD superfamily [Rhodovulum sp. ES.010]|uniref:pyrimidine 5'-nucleotidase n=1 Tax=Rhodovulum sp. ES.010 TaxID=1882821 RepID=UPI00092AD7A1|nr:pyrimidine 5'-nucleotidase [Rhodovulum sp. ES.010]SIO32857.1 putative hydrolase of the HAD superfamily [Rhodovulum sp. ES.010]